MAADPAEWDRPRRLEAAAPAERVFRRLPRHPGAAHYLIHAYDEPALAPRGLAAARVYARIAPASSHARHMPSHIFVQLGRWLEAEHANRDAFAASQAEAAKRGAGPDEHDYHAYAWLQYAHLQQGRVREARAALDTMVTIARAHPSGYTNFHATLMAVHLGRETGAWPADAPLAPGGGSTGVYLAGMRALAAGDSAGVAAAVARGRALAGTARSAAARRAFVLVEKELVARRHRAVGRLADARVVLEEAAAVEDSVGAPYGPPVVQPAHEHLGEVLLLLGDAPRAVEHFDRALRLTPGRTAALRGRARAAAAAGERP
jgi:tetratricopeptide (TPR) repeat protein